MAGATLPRFPHDMRGGTMAQDVSVTEDGGVLTVTFDRPAKRNAISLEMTAALWESANLLANRDDLRVLIITARGPYFTAGIDLKTGNARDQARESEYPDMAYRQSYRQMTNLYDEFEAIEKPIILAAQGHCLGAGIEMAASCDFRFAARGVTFSLPEVRLGIIAGSGGTSRLTRLVGPHWAKYLAMAGQRVDADRALVMGLVHEVFPEDSFQDDVLAFARDLMTIPPEGMGLAKVIVDMSVDTDRIAQRHIDRLANTTLTASEDYSRRIASFRKDR
jgi:enoyl-CoA hydratase